MKLPVVIQEHPDGFIVKVPDDEFEEMLKSAKHVNRSEMIDNLARREAEEIKKSSGEIPERWKVTIKRFSGFVYGVEGVGSISAEADTVEELLTTLKNKATEICRGLEGSARREWPQHYQIAEIEI